MVVLYLVFRIIMSIKAFCRSVLMIRPLKRCRRFWVVMPDAGTWARNSATVGNESVSVGGAAVTGTLC